MEKIKVSSRINITVFGKNDPKGKDISKNKNGELESVRPGWTEKRIDFKADKKYELTPEQFKWKSVQGLIKGGHLEVLASDSEINKMLTKEEKKEVVTKEVSEKDKLVAKCKELGISHRKNATEETLQSLIDEHEKTASAEELPPVE